MDCTPSYLSPSLPLSTPFIQSSIAVYDIESGQKRFVIPVEGGERNVLLPRHLLPLQGTHIACSTGRDIQILPCNVKLKVD